MSKTIKIFVASSEELKAEREMLAKLANELNTPLDKLGIHIIMEEWENLDASMGVKHKQEEYNDKLRECDMCIVLYWTKRGMYTQMELDTAVTEMNAGRNPHKIYVYFKNSDYITNELKEFRDSFPTKYGHFSTFFANTDTLKAHFILQFMEYQSNFLQKQKMAEVKDGHVYVDGTEYVDLKNVPFAGNNEEYNLLKKSIKKTQKLLSITEPDDPDYTEYASDLQEMQDKLSKMEVNLWDTALMITRLSTTKCSERLQRAMDLFSNGDNKGAQAILNEEDINKDVEHNMHLIQLGEEGRKGLQVNIDEIKLKISILGTEMPDGWIQEQCRLHKRVVELTIALYGENSLEAADAMMDATGAFYLQEDYYSTYDFTKKALDIRLQFLGENNLETAQCFNDLGVASGTLGKYQDGFDNVNKALEIRLALNAPEEMLAESYCNMGAAYKFIGNKEKNLECQLKALDLRRKAFGEMNLETANSYSETASAYSDMQDDEIFLKYSLRALEIAKETVGEQHPDTGLYHNNVGVSYLFLGNYQEAIHHLKKSLDIELSTKGKFVFGALTMFDNLSFAYKKTGDIKTALDYIMEAISISEHINGEIHAKTLELFERAGRLLDDFGDRKLSLDYLYHAFGIRFEMAKQENRSNGPAPSEGLAYLNYCISSLHYDMHEYEDAQRMMNNAINIMLDVDEKDPRVEEWKNDLSIIEEQLSEQKQGEPSKS